MPKSPFHRAEKKSAGRVCNFCNSISNEKKLEEKQYFSCFHNFLFFPLDITTSFTHSSLSFVISLTGFCIFAIINFSKVGNRIMFIYRCTDATATTTKNLSKLCWPQNELWRMQKYFDKDDLSLFLFLRRKCGMSECFECLLEWVLSGAKTKQRNQNEKLRALLLHFVILLCRSHVHQMPQKQIT